MKRITVMTACLFVMIGLQTARTQTIIRVEKGYVVIDRSTGLGKTGSTLYVYRTQDGKIIDVGQVRIVKFGGGRTAALIIQQEAGITVRQGDFVRQKRFGLADVSGLQAMMQPPTDKPSSGSGALPPLKIETEKAAPPQSAHPDTVRLTLEPESEDAIPQDAEAETVPTSVYTPEEQSPQQSTSGLSLPSVSFPFQAGFHVGGFLPASGLEEGMEGAVNLGVAVRFLRLGRHTFAVEASYPLIDTEPSHLIRFNNALLLVHLSDHIRIAGPIHYDIGGGLYQAHASFSILNRTITDWKTNLGGFAGFSLDLPLLFRVTLSPCIRYHAYRDGTTWREFVTGGVTMFGRLLP